MFKLHFDASAMLWSLIVITLDNGIYTILIFSIQMTWLMAVMKLMFLARILLKSHQSLYKCWNAQKPKN